MATNNNNVYSPPSLDAPDWRLLDSTLYGEGCSADGKFQEQIAAEALDISGVPVHVFRLLGVHEQGLLVDLTGSGYPISSGSAPSYNDSNAFNTAGIGWRSILTGLDVVTAPAFIGYSFGTKRVGTTSGNAGTEKYAPAAPIRRMITTLKLQQGPAPENRALQIKVERSDDGVEWKRVDIVNVPNTASVATINIKGSAPSMYWRIIPLMFGGATITSAYWEVIKLELMDFEATSIDNIEDLFFMENRDRDYATSSVILKTQYQPFDSMGDLSKFGFNLMEQYTFTVSFARMVEALGRPIVVGDIIELPSEIQYDHHLRPIKTFLEITDSGWSSEGYTTGWRPILYRFMASQLIPAAENKDVMMAAGDSLNYPNSAMSDDNFFSGVRQIDNSAQRAADVIKADASSAVPETGQDTSSVQVFVPVPENDGPIKAPYGTYGIEDGLPPNGLPYLEGYVLPDTTVAADGDYFRLNYDPATKIPSRLFRFSSMKNKWMYVETDRRQAYSSFKPSMQALMTSPGRKNLSDI